MKILKYNYTFNYKHILILKYNKIKYLVNNINIYNNIRYISYFFNLNKINLSTHSWIQCDNCYNLNYSRVIKLKYYICEYCNYHFKMNSFDRIYILIDFNTWNSLNEYLFSKLNFDENKLYNYRNLTGLTESIQIGIGTINNIKITLGVMDFEFIGGSMGSVVGEKITCLFEYTISNFIPLILVCSSGGARMQEGSISLMQMAKISSLLYEFQQKYNLFYLSILSSPTTGGVISSFGMLGDIIISEPNSTITFTGKRVIEQTLNQTIPENSQISENLFIKGLFDLIIPRNLLKKSIIDLLKLHKY
uniref:Acetyl-coenzyme A carboxylase carboxyl transferase subunit beta n=1 Tax=Rhopalocnemis phalloides TaxID=1128106 RepID=A0A3S8PZC5_9MAGN|nr:acetyl-CoA carboxylase carboxyltransferase beta subunit [Rhopalocnemis phalloides]